MKPIKHILPLLITAALAVTNLSAQEYNAQSSPFTFDMRLWELTTGAHPTEGGTVSEGGSYLQWKPLQLEAFPSSAYLFLNWTDDEEEISTDQSFQYIMPGEDKTLLASFMPQLPTVADQTVTYDGNEHSLSATAPEGLEIVWYNAAEGGDIIEAPSATDAGIYTAWVASVDNTNDFESERVQATLTIQKRNLTITGSFAAADKLFDGTTDATITDNQLDLHGVINDEDVLLHNEVAAFAQSSVGDNIPVIIISAGLTGADADNYAVSVAGAPVTSASISVRPITVSADNKLKEYGDPDPALTYQVTSGSLAGNDQFTGSLSRETGEALGSYAIEQGSLSLSQNYDLSFIPGTFTILPKTLTIAGFFTVEDKVYDATTDATITDNQLDLQGVINDEDVSLHNVAAAFTQSEVGEDIPVNIVSAELTGADISKYALSLEGSPAATASIIADYPTITTTGVSDITDNAVVSGGNISCDGGALVTQRGVCYGTNPNPTLDDLHTNDGTGMGQFISNVAGLQPHTIYYLRAYATNSAGTSYGEQVSFLTLLLHPYTLSGGGEYCDTSMPSGIHAHLDGSQEGVSYQLYRDGSSYGPAQIGDGQPLSWEDLPDGEYTVLGSTMSNSQWMNGSVTVVAHLPVSLSDVDALPQQICIGANVQLSLEYDGGCGVVEIQWSSSPSGFSSSFQNPVANPVENTTYFVTVSDSVNEVNASVFVEVFSDEPLLPVTNMMPIDYTVINQPALTLSWQPDLNASHFDLYVWEASEEMPHEPSQSNLQSIQYFMDGLSHATEYKWMVVAKNPCHEIASAIKHFSVVELPDLIVSDIQVPLNPSTGQEIEISWTVFNQGDIGTPDTGWWDMLYLSEDTVINTDVDTFIGAIPNFSSLLPNTGYSNSFNFTLPNHVYNDKYIIIRADAYNNVNESDINNNLSFEPIHISLTPPPDLVVSSIIVPTVAFSGDDILVQWTTTNQGTGGVYGSQWVDKIYLSTEPEFNQLASTYLGQQSFNHQLLPGESYGGSRHVTLPEQIFGNYYIYVHTDANNNVFEHAFDDNNVSQSDLFEIILTPPPDLTAMELAYPLVVSNNEQITVNYTIVNQGGSATSNSWRDKVYLSPEPVFNEETAMELGEKLRNMTLQPGAEEPVDVQVFIPPDITGDFFVYVFVDCYDEVFEFDNTENNIVRGELPITVHHADLAVSNVGNPLAAGNSQEITVSWSIANEGLGVTPGYWTDIVFLSPDPVFDPNVAIPIGEKQMNITLQPNETYDASLQVLTPLSISGDFYVIVVADFDQEVFEAGSIQNNEATGEDILTISHADLAVSDIQNPISASNNEPILVNWTVTNMGEAATGNHWFDKVFLSPEPFLDEDTRIEIGKLSKQVLLEPGESYHSSLEITTPVDISGSFYVFVFADFYDDVCEGDLLENNIDVGDDLFTIKHPDLTVHDIVLAETTYSGSKITVNWEIGNIGDGRIFDRVIHDKIYLSEFSEFPVNDPIEIGSLSYSSTLEPGNSVSHNAFITIPSGISGEYYVFVHTNADGNVFENGLIENNYAMEPIFVYLSSYPDLAVENVTHPQEIILGLPFEFEASIRNEGFENISNCNWIDALLVSESSTPDLAIDTLLWFHSDMDLPVEEKYTVDAEINFSIEQYHGFDGLYLHFISDAENNIFETDIENNLYSSAFIPLSLPPGIDLKLSSASTETESSKSGQTIDFSYSVENISTSAAVWGISEWYDAVYLSSEPYWDPDNVVLISEYFMNEELQSGNNYSINQSFTVPHDLSGEWYFLVVTDHNKTTNDMDYANNAASLTGETPVFIEETLYPDLQVADFDSPLTGIAGQPINIDWQVENVGDGPAEGSSWTDKVFLSANFEINQDDLTLVNKQAIPPLDVNESYANSVEVFLPVNATGPHILIFKTNANRDLWETGSGMHNNYSYAGIHITQPPPADLIVKDVVYPRTFETGDTINIQYTLKNIGDNPANGYLRDIIYLSNDSVWNYLDPIIGQLNHQINLAPQMTQTLSVSAAIPGVQPDDYYVFVRTNARNNIFEYNYENNLGRSDGFMSFVMPQLVIGEERTDVLQNSVPRYYKLVVSEELDQETLLISLRGDSLSGVNELYLSHDAIPSRSNHHFSSTVPFNANQELVVPELDVGNYYLLVYGNSSANGLQDINLMAEIIPFSIRSINASKGGNTGKITVRIEGAKFEQAMQVKLNNWPVKQCIGKNIVLVNSTTMYATFDLENAPIGYYDLVLEKADGEIAELSNGFEVVAGVPAALSVNVIGPSSIRPNRISSFNIVFSNAGNTDLIDPVITINGQTSSPLGLSVEQLSQQLTKLTVSLHESNGPPGILRPGYLGQFTVFIKATAGLGFVIEY